ncbi:MAG: cupin protein [Solirubrobacterales bacterium]|nr:cupin protein [Solirubrobacterales bacterium]
MNMPRFNLFGAEFERDPTDPEGYHTGMDRFGKKIGAQEMGGSVYELPPGQSVCPYHYEYAEEWLIVLEGHPTLRQPSGESVLDPGDVVCFPPGPEGAHKVTNGGDEEVVRVLMISSERPPFVAVYPDSDKIGIFPGNRDDNLMVRRESNVDYWDRES